MVPKYSAEVLTSVPQHKKAVMCLPEKMCVLDKLPSGMGPSDFGNELMLVNPQYILK